MDIPTVKPVAKEMTVTTYLSQAASNKSGIKNKTMVTRTGNATATIVNKITVPFNQTIVSAGEANQTTGQGQQGQQQQPSNASSSQQQSVGGGGCGRTEQENQQNNTQGQGNDPLNQMGKSIGNLFRQ